VLAGLEEVVDFQIIQDWEKTTEIGDRAEIRTLPESSTVWAKVDAARICAAGRSVRFPALLHHPDAPARGESDIVIVNHHLFFADLALKNEEWDGGILPDYDAVVFDEAHEIEDVAGQYFGVSVSNYRFQELRRDISAVARMKKFGAPELDRILDRLEELTERFFSLFERRNGAPPFRAASPSARRTRRSTRIC